MVSPRAFSSGSRSVSMPVSARTSEVLPWSTCPAVAMIMSCPGTGVLALKLCAAMMRAMAQVAVPQIETTGKQAFLGRAFVAIVKRDCPTCELTMPVLRRIEEFAAPFGGSLEVHVQDDPSFAAGFAHACDDTARPPGEVIGMVPPNLAACTVEKVAVNAVMAGCRPEYMPVVLTAVETA